MEALEGMVGWCVPGFAAAATARRLPGVYKGERFWHGKATVERHRHWVVPLPVLTEGVAAVTVGFDGTWAWVARPAPGSVVPTGVDDVQAAFDGALTD